MADFYDQAKAIWSALDTMMTQDPEGYKKFITQQLQEGKQVMEQETPRTSRSTQASSVEGVEKAFGALRVNDTTGERKIEKLDKKCPQGSLDNRRKVSEGIQSETSLLDESISGKGSVVAKIVRHPEPAEEEDEDKRSIIADLRIPRMETTPTVKHGKNKKPLIEEL